MSSKELYKKYRPKKLDHLVGQAGVIKTLKAFLKRKSLPQTILLSGPSGCGKTTIGRILRRKLKCHKTDFYEINGSDENGIDDMRRIRKQIRKAPMSGSCMVWLIDEAHKISPAAQDMMLTMLEDTPDDVYFLLATTDPKKLKPAIRTRSTEIAVKLLPRKLITQIIKDILKKEKEKVSSEVIDAIIESAEGSARKALVLLNQVYLLDGEDEMLEAIEETTVAKASEFIGRLLINPRVTWSTVAKALKEYKQEDAESIRWGILGYARNCMLGGGAISARAYVIVDAFRDHFYDSKNAGLAAACWEVVQTN